MLFMCMGCWKPENDEDMWKRLVERKVPLPEEIKAIEYYYLPGRHQMIVIAEALDEMSIAKSALNWHPTKKFKFKLKHTL